MAGEQALPPLPWDENSGCRRALPGFDFFRSFTVRWKFSAARVIPAGDFTRRRLLLSVDRAHWRRIPVGQRSASGSSLPGLCQFPWNRVGHKSALARREAAPGHGDDRRQATIPLRLRRGENSGGTLHSRSAGLGRNRRRNRPQTRGMARGRPMPSRMPMAMAPASTSVSMPFCWNSAMSDTISE